MKLHIGSRSRAEGWTTLDAEPGPEVDYLGDCQSLTQFADQSLDTIYASHVLEHLPYRQIDPALKDWCRALRPGGTVMVAVPDFEVLAKLYLHPQAALEDRFLIIQMIFGGQLDKHDFHRVGFNAELLHYCLNEAGFTQIARVADFGLFDDTSRIKYRGVPISLNMTAKKPG